MARNIMSVFSQRSDAHEATESEQPVAADSESSEMEQARESSRSTVMLGKTLIFKGELDIGEDALLFGRVEGKLTHSEGLTVGVGGVIIGDVSGRAITIKGLVQGDITATESVTIVPGATVVGDVVAPRINIIEGALFNGAIKMPPQPAPAAKQPTPALAPDGALSEEAVEQLLHLLAERKKA